VTDPVVPRYLERVEASTERLLATLEDALTDDAVSEESRLPGWTRGHVVTHIARNADSHRRRLEAAGRGETVEQYEGGLRGREAQIQAGAGRSAAELIADVATSAAALRAVYDTMAGDDWYRSIGEASGVERRAGELPAGRWQELEIHHVDLALGYEPDDWPADFVDEVLEQLTAQGGRLPDGLAVTLVATDRERPAITVGRGEPIDVEGTAAQLLAYLLGRPSNVTGTRRIETWG